MTSRDPLVFLNRIEEEKEHCVPSLYTHKHRSRHHFIPLERMRFCLSKEKVSGKQKRTKMLAHCEYFLFCFPAMDIPHISFIGRRIPSVY